MNIKNRIEKLENAAGVNSEFCGCPSRAAEKGCQMIMMDMDRSEHEREALIAEAQKPEFCDLCGKQIEKHLIIIQAAQSRDGPNHPARPGETFATFQIDTKDDRLSG